MRFYPEWYSMYTRYFSTHMRIFYFFVTLTYVGALAFGCTRTGSDAAWVIVWATGAYGESLCEMDPEVRTSCDTVSDVPHTCMTVPKMCERSCNESNFPADLICILSCFEVLRPVDYIAIRETQKENISHGFQIGGCVWPEHVFQCSEQLAPYTVSYSSWMVHQHICTYTFIPHFWGSSKQFEGGKRRFLVWYCCK